MRQFYLVILTGLFIGCFKDYSKYDKFNEPQISSYPDNNMLVCEIEGDPNETAGTAISILYKSFYKIKNEFNLESHPPQAKWITPYEIPKNKWIGKYALPLNKKVTKLPENLTNDDSNLVLEIWEGGDYAELLHIGKYEDINITSGLLEEFVLKSGYVINGYHEEIYIKGPGMFFNGNPKKYLTLIRYPVTKLN